MTKKPFFSTTVWVLMGRAGGVLVPFLVAVFMGAGPATDAFFFAYAAIFSLQNIFAHIFESALVPYMAERKDSPQRAQAFTLQVLKTVFPVISLLSLAFGFLLPVVLNAQASVPPETARMISRFYWEMLPGLLIAALISAYQGFFYANKNFWFPSVSPVFRTLLMAGCFIFGRSEFGIHSLTFGFTLGEIVRWAAAHFVLTRGNGVEFSGPVEDVSKILEFFRQAGFQFMALVAVNLIPMADQWAAAPLGGGNLSLFNYADRLMQVPYLLFFYAFTQVFLSFWSESHAQEKFSVFFKKVEKDTWFVFAGSSVFVLPLWFYAEPALNLIFSRSNLTPEQLRVLTDVFRWLALGFVPGILRILYGRVLIIMRKSGFYFFQAWVELFLKIGLNFWLVSLFGVAGLAMATAIIYSLTALWLFYYLKVNCTRS